MSKKWKDDLFEAYDHGRGDIEICKHCGDLILDAIHDCQEELDEQNYSDRLQKGFDMLDMED